jgi:hypothetical protein
MQLTKSQHASLVLACQFALSEVTRALDEGEFGPDESMVAVCRIRDYNDLLEMLQNDIRSVTTYG